MCLWLCIVLGVNRSESVIGSHSFQPSTHSIPSNPQDIQLGLLQIDRERKK